jgi:hypothetical protein
VSRARELESKDALAATVMSQNSEDFCSRMNREQRATAEKVKATVLDTSNWLKCEALLRLLPVMAIPIGTAIDRNEPRDYRVLEVVLGVARDRDDSGRRQAHGEARRSGFDGQGVEDSPSARS